jgi:hypothetical protein
VELDLTEKLPAASQYRVRFVPDGGARLSLRDLTLLVDGAPQPTLARPAPGRHDVVILTIPGIGYHVTLRVRVQGARRGTVLLQRL